MNTETLSNLPEYECHRRNVRSFPAAADEVWNELPTIHLKETVNGSAPRLATTVEAFWTEYAFYVRFTCEDDFIKATMDRRDAPIYKEDVVEVFIDETGRLREYKEFELSPANVQFDAAIAYDQGGPRVNVQWDARGWVTQVVPIKEEDVAQGWIAVWELPFSLFEGGTPSAGDVWRINFYRIDRGDDRKKDEYMAWSPTGAVNFHMPERFGSLRFVD